MFNHENILAALLNKVENMFFFILSLDHNIYISIHHYIFSDRLLFLVELLTPTKIRLFPLLEQQ